LTLRPEYEALLKQARSSDPETAKAIADEVYSFFEEALEERTICIAAVGPRWDAGRVAIDTAVVHHTNLPAGIDWRRIDAIHLTRIYARYYASPAPVDDGIRGQPIFSGHFRDRQVFFAYHWLVRRDGMVERLLNVDETGWQAGDWEANCRSIAICFDGCFEATAPSRAALEASAHLINQYAIAPQRILGHREVNAAAGCPGSAFLGGWKRDLVQLSQRRDG